jgi:hypothetical protein
MLQIVRRNQYYYRQSVPLSDVFRQVNSIHFTSAGESYSMESPHRGKRGILATNQA